MNLWQCQDPGCTSRAVGVGGAAGLLAIGWDFEPGPTLFCPLHRRDPIPCSNPPAPRADGLCSLCRAERCAFHWQSAINDHHGWEP
jgi:hypothetical protein